MNLRALAVLATALLLPLAASACGDSGDGGKPTIANISDQLQKSGMPAKQADCTAKAAEKAGFTADEYQKMADKPNLDDPKVRKFATAVAACSGGSTASIPTNGTVTIPGGANAPSNGTAPAPGNAPSNGTAPTSGG